MDQDSDEFYEAHAARHDNEYDYYVVVLTNTEFVNQDRFNDLLLDDVTRRAEIVHDDENWATVVVENLKDNNHPQIWDWGTLTAADSIDFHGPYEYDDPQINRWVGPRLEIEIV